MDEANPEAEQVDIDGLIMEFAERSPEIIDGVNVRMIFFCDQCGQSAEGWAVLSNFLIQ